MKHNRIISLMCTAVLSLTVGSLMMGMNDNKNNITLATKFLTEDSNFSQIFVKGLCETYVKKNQALMDDLTSKKDDTGYVLERIQETLRTSYAPDVKDPDGQTTLSEAFKLALPALTDKIRKELNL